MIIAIDATNWGHVLYHALRGNGVVDAFNARIDAIQRTWDVSRLICAFDRRSFRHDLFDGYKSGRNHDDAIADVLRELEKSCKSRSGVLTIAENEFEADDVLATVARLAVESQTKCVLATPDKDVRQCLRAGKVTILKGWKLNRGVIEPEWLTAERLRISTGITASQWIDYQCLVGDSSDGIEGCPGIGHKTAVALLQKHGTLDAILADVWSCTVRQGQRNALSTFKSRVDQVRRLVTLVDRVPWVSEALELETV